MAEICLKNLLETVKDTEGFIFCDTHCHLLCGLNGEKADPTDVIAHSVESKVRYFIIPSVSIADADSNLSFAVDKKNIATMIGVHPAYALTSSSEEVRNYILIRHPVLIGEIGLDRRFIQNVPLDKQCEIFNIQLEAAAELQVPVSLHVVGEYGKALQIVKKYSRKIPCGIVHGFSGSPETALEFVKLGFMIGVGPMLLNPKTVKLIKTVQAIGSSSLVLETDWPYMWYRNRNGEKVSAGPWVLPEILFKISSILKEDPLLLAFQMQNNLHRILPDFGD